MIDVMALPALNATLNGLAACFLGAGYMMIRRRRIGWHRAFMLAAFATSMVFLASYTVYHLQAGSRPFQGQGAIRLLYFAILITHVVLAAAIVPMVLVTLARALARQYPRHARLARWTLPLWLYVSVTGVVIYVMLYGI